MKRNDELRQSCCDVCWLAWVRENSISWNGFSWLFFFFLMDLFVCCVILTLLSFACFLAFQKRRDRAQVTFGLSFRLPRAKGPRGQDSITAPALHSLPHFRLQLCYQALAAGNASLIRKGYYCVLRGANKPKEISRQSSPQILSWISSKPLEFQSANLNWNPGKNDFSNEMCSISCLFFSFFFFKFLVIPHSILVPWQKIKPMPLHWKHGILTFVPPGKSLLLFLKSEIPSMRGQKESEGEFKN